MADVAVMDMGAAPAPTNAKLKKPKKKKGKKVRKRLKQELAQLMCGKCQLLRQRQQRLDLSNTCIVNSSIEYDESMLSRR